MILWLLVSVLLVVFWRQNYPRGFSRHGDYTIKESQVLEQYGQAFKALDSGERKPATKEEKEFVAFCRGERAPETFFEKTWNKYRTRINTTKRVYTLSGDVSESGFWRRRLFWRIIHFKRQAEACLLLFYSIPMLAKGCGIFIIQT